MLGVAKENPCIISNSDVLMKLRMRIVGPGFRSLEIVTFQINSYGWTDNNI